MKANISLVLSSFFITLSIWLSFSVKKTNENLYRADTQIKTMERELSISKYQLDILQEALVLNLGKAPLPTRLTAPSRLTNNPGSFELVSSGLQNILYLKAHACSPCNMPVIEGLINAAADNSNFQIASHASNRHFLQPVIQKNGLADTERVNWLSGKLYDYQQPVYDAELLLVDAKGLFWVFCPWSC